MEMKTTLKLYISSCSGTQGVYIGIRGTGGQGTNPGRKRGRGHTVAPRRFKPRAAQLVPCQVMLPVSDF